MSFIRVNNIILNADKVRYVELTFEDRQFFNNNFQTDSQYKICTIYFDDGKTIVIDSKVNNDPKAPLVGQLAFNQFLDELEKMGLLKQ